MIEVRRIFVFQDGDVLHREVALVRSRIPKETEADLLRFHPGAAILQRGSQGTLLQVAGTEAEISRLIEHLTPFGITEFVRSGRIAVTPAGEYDTDLLRSLHDLRPGATEGPDV
jgi:acetolactate synthase-1/3 small subunit